jgi:hypothetical protein
MMWKLLSPNWEIRVLEGIDSQSECHHSKFIPKSLLPTYFQDLKVQAESDSVRLALIRIYGGVYLDATVLLLQPLELDHWNHVDKPVDDPDKKAMVGYYTKLFSRPNIKEYVELWLIIAKAQEPIIIAWHDLYLKLIGDSKHPIVVNETTHELLNPVMKGVNFSSLLDPGLLNYGFGSNCMIALTQLNDHWNFTYNYKSIIRNADEYVIFFRNKYSDGDVNAIYNYMFRSHDFTKDSLYEMLRNVPMIKLFQHAFYISDERYAEWGSLRNRWGLLRVNNYNKVQKWNIQGIWDPSFW